MLKDVIGKKVFKNFVLRSSNLFLVSVQIIIKNVFTNRQLFSFVLNIWFCTNIIKTVYTKVSKLNKPF